MTKLNHTRHTKPMVRDSNDEMQVKAALDGEKDREKDLVFIVAQPRGRRWLHEVIYQMCHLDSLSHVPGDTHSTAFNEGARSVGQRILSEIRVQHHDAFIKMMEENRSDE